MTNLEDALIKNDFHCIYDIYHEKEKHNQNDYAIEYLSYILCTLENGANIFLNNDSKKDTLLDCIYCNDFYGALKLSEENIIITHLLNEILDRSRNNIISNYQGNYSENFYNHIEMLYSSFNDPMAINEIITSYFYSMGQDELVPLLGDIGPFVNKYNKYNDLANFLSTFNYPGNHIDIDVIVEWFKDALEAHDIVNAKYLYKALSELDKDNKDLYHYLLEQINNPESEEIFRRASIKRNTMSEIACTKSTKDISEISYNDKIDEYIIKNELLKHDDIKFIQGEKSFYIAPYLKEHHEDLETLHFGSLKSIEIGNHQAALRKMRILLECNKEFNEELLGRMLNSYRAINNYYMASTINHLLDEITIEKDEEVIKYEESRSTFNYLIPNIDAIIFEVMKQGKGALTVVDKYNLSEDDKKYAYAILAREYYKAGYLPVGDKLLKLARKLDDKQDNEYHSLLGEIETNRKYYQYRTDVTFIDELRKVLK